jgi:hypothetical protein
VGAVLVPPPAPVTNTCSGLAGVGTEAGICVTGRDVTFGPFNVSTAPSHPSDAGHETWSCRASRSGASPARTWPSSAQPTQARRQPARGRQPIRRAECRIESQSISHNIVTAADTLRYIGIYTDDAGPAVLNGNDVSGYIFGLCIETQATDIGNNVVHHTTASAFSSIPASAPACATITSTQTTGRAAPATPGWAWSSKAQSTPRSATTSSKDTPPAAPAPTTSSTTTGALPASPWGCAAKREQALAARRWNPSNSGVTQKPGG